MSNKKESDKIPYENEFVQLTEHAGIRMQPEIIRILLELLRMNYDPRTIYTILRHLHVKHEQHKAQAVALLKKQVEKKKK